MSKTILVALGGNLPSTAGMPQSTIVHAIMRLNESGFTLVAVSRFYETPCFPAGAGPDYVNAAAIVRSNLTPAEALARLHDIETDFGRARETRWGMRTLDLDLLAIDDLVVPDAATHATWRDLPMQDQVRATPDQLILPHPRLQDRAFVLGPLMDIASGWMHPLIGKTVAEIYATLPEEDRKALKSL